MGEFDLMMPHTGQLGVIIWTNLVVLEYLMLYIIMFQGNWLSGFEEDF